MIDEKLIAAYEKDADKMLNELDDWGLDVYSQKCKKCYLETHSEGLLRQHKLESHNIKESKNESKYQCPKCDFKTAYKRLLDTHLNTHKHRYQCDDCSFFTNRQLEFEKHNAHYHKYLIPIKAKKRENIVIIGF